MRKRKKEMDALSDDEEEDNEKEEDRTCPTITLTREDKLKLQTPWKHTLIIKIWGRQVGYAYLLCRITSIWKPKAKMELIAMENDYYLVKFNFVEDYEHAQLGGPWMVMDHYLLVRDWTPYFDPWRAGVEEKLTVWVRFSDLPIEFYDYEFLMKLGGRIGEPKNIDEATSLVSRGKFTRMCVEIDITKPLVSKFILRKKFEELNMKGYT